MHQYRSRSVLRTCSGLAIIAGLAVTTAAHAEDTTNTQAASDDVSQDIIVTAQFRDESLQQTPLAITAISAEALEQRGHSDISQISDAAPNVSLRPSGGGAFPSVTAFIRGVGQTYFSFAEEPGVGIYIDDVYFSTMTGSMFDLLDLDRVEILRGPQGTLAGKNSEGGAIKLYSKRPDGNGGGYVEAAYGGLNQINARASVDFTLAPDKVFVRLAAVTKHREGYVTRLDYNCTHPGTPIQTFAPAAGCELGKDGSQGLTAVRAALRWIPTDTIEVNISGDYTFERETSPASILLAAKPNGTSLNGVQYGCAFVVTGVNSCDTAHITDPYTSYATYIDPTPASALEPWKPFAVPSLSELKSWGVSAVVDWNPAENISVKSITGYRAYTTAENDDVDGSPIQVQIQAQRQRHHQFSEELRLSANLLDQVDLTVGGFYFDQYGDETTRVDAEYVPYFDFLNGYDTTPANTKAAFAHVAWHATSQFTISGGLRYTTESKKFTFARHNPDGTPICSIPWDQPGGCANYYIYGLDGVEASFKGNRWDYRLNASYQITPDVMTYAQVSTGYKGGGVNPVPFFPKQAAAFAPEDLTAYEAGLKMSFLNRKIIANTAVFYNKFKNIVLISLSCDDLSPFPGAPCFAPRNVGSADVKGFEFETQLRPVTGLQIDGSLAYLDFQYTDTDFAKTGVSLDAKPPYTPKWKWNVGAQYEIDLGGFGTLTPRLDVTYQSDVFADSNNSPAAIDVTKTVATPSDQTSRISAYTLANARLTWANASNDLQVSLEVSNLTDKLYYLTLFNSWASQGYVAGSPGLPRQWLVSVKKTF